MNQKQPLEMFCKEVFLKISQILQENILQHRLVTEMKDRFDIKVYLTNIT